MQQLLSKDVMYDPMLQICERVRCCCLECFRTRFCLEANSVMFFLFVCM